MSKVEARLGLTNITKRLAHHYLCRGFGNYKIDHPMYDAVHVGELYSWKQSEETGEYGAGIKVTFSKNGKRIRWVEFGIRFVGGGGDQAIFKLEEK
jgi:hypothetical protein